METEDTSWLGKHIPGTRLKRRDFLRLSSLALLAACNASPGDKTTPTLQKSQRFNDWVQGGVFSNTRLSEEIAESDLTPESGFRVNGKDRGHPNIDIANWRLEIAGLVEHPGVYTLEDIKKFPKTVMNTKHVCVEGWSMNPKWGGTQLALVLEAAGASKDAKYLYAECWDGYYVPYDMPSARHPQTLLCYEAYNKPLSPDHGAPLRIVMPVKLGYKSAKWLKRLTVTNKKPGGYWEDQGYDWFGGL
jgi:DMSO/TMAO reductase YedYZ molybdopterin-dependent catalytic subunit